MASNIAEHRYNSPSLAQTRSVALHDRSRPCLLFRLALFSLPLAFITCPPSLSSKHVDIWKHCCPPPLPPVINTSVAFEVRHTHRLSQPRPFCAEDNRTHSHCLVFSGSFGNAEICRVFFPSSFRDVLKL